MSSEHVVTFLVAKQSEEQVSASTMAARLGMGETAWSHVRRGRRRLTVAQIERATELYPEIAEKFALPRTEAVAS